MEPIVGNVVTVRVSDKQPAKPCKILAIKNGFNLFLAMATDGSIMVSGDTSRPTINGSFAMDGFCPLGANAYKPKSAAKALGFTGQINI